MNNLILFAVSIIAISILGYLAVRSTARQEEKHIKIIFIWQSFFLPM